MYITFLKFLQKCQNNSVKISSKAWFTLYCILTGLRKQSFLDAVILSI